MKKQNNKIILPSGGYRKLRSFQTAQIVYDGTVVFCERFIDRFSRTKDQMVQAARSGVQNIAEGSVASATSKKTEIRLTNVARASLEELLLDYEDFLRQRGLPLWSKDSPAALSVRRKGKSDWSDRSDASDLSDPSDPSDPYSLAEASGEFAANTLICLTNQASYLLGRQIQSLEQQFLKERKALGLPMMTQTKLQKLDHRDRPINQTQKTKMPLCHALSWEAAKIYKDAFREFLNAYKIASVYYRMGALDIEFPQGSIKPPILTVQV